jgi:hypothetical protein
MEGLVVVDGACVLGPELDLVEVEVGGLEVALGRIDEVGVDGEVVEVPRAVRELLDAGKLACVEAGVVGGGRIGEEVLGRRKCFQNASCAAFSSSGARKPSSSEKP